jgi:hypothetical protein
MRRDKFNHPRHARKRQPTDIDLRQEPPVAE